MDTKINNGVSQRLNENHSNGDLISENSKFILERFENEDTKIKFPKENEFSLSDSGADKNEIHKMEEVKNPTDKSDKGFCGRYLGIVLSILTAFFFTLGSLVIKYMNGYHPFTLAVYRFQGILLPSLPLLVHAKCFQKKDIFSPVLPLTHNSNWKNVLFLAVRGLTGCVSLVLYFYCLKYLTIGDATIVGSVKPVFVYYVAHVLLGEKCGIFPTFVAILTILGVGIILRPPILSGQAFDWDLLIGSAYALGSVIAFTLSVTIVRHVRNINTWVVLFIVGTTGTILTLILSVSFGVFAIPEESTDVFYALALAVVTFVTQTLTIWSLKKEQAGIVSLIRTVDIIFAMFWQFIFLGIIPDIFSIIGAAVIILGVVLITWSKWLSTLSAGHPTKKKYSFALK